MTGATPTHNPYETDELLNQYLDFHYGDTAFGVDNYAVACARQCLAYLQDRPKSRALDLGCAVGRSSFELARVIPDVTGIDLSSRFIGACRHLQAGETLSCFRRDEGWLGQTVPVSLKGTDLLDTAGRIRFETGNACRLDERHTGFDLVFAGNLIDRVDDPAALLHGLRDRIRPGGLLVLSSPYTLLAEYTSQENWLGGRLFDGQPRTMLEGITQALSGHFRMFAPPIDMPFVIRETARKFQHSIAQMSVWERI